MRSIFLLAFFLAFLSGLALPLAASAAPITTATLDELMDLSGLDAQLQSYPESIREAALADARQRGASSGELARIERLAETTFMAHDFRGAMIAALRDGVTEEDAGELLGWFRSELGARVTAAEEAAGTPAAQREMQRRAQALLLSEERVAIARRMDAVVGATEMLLTLQEGVVRALFGALAGQGPDGPGAAELEDELAGSRAARRAAVQQFNTISFVYTYKPLEVAEVRRYLDFLETPASRRFHELVVGRLAADTEVALLAFLEGYALGPAAGG